MASEPQTFTREEINARVRSLIGHGTTDHEKIADILKSEGFRTKKGAPIKAGAVRFFMKGQTKKGAKKGGKGPKKPAYKTARSSNNTPKRAPHSKGKATLNTVAHILRSQDFGGAKSRISAALAVLEALS
jgi:hypothetical protein